MQQYIHGRENYRPLTADLPPILQLRVSACHANASECPRVAHSSAQWGGGGQHQPPLSSGRPWTLVLSRMRRIHGWKKANGVNVCVAELSFSLRQRSHCGCCPEAAIASQSLLYDAEHARTHARIRVFILAAVPLENPRVGTGEDGEEKRATQLFVRLNSEGFALHYLKQRVERRKMQIEK